jgi:hypothetical protein
VQKKNLFVFSLVVLCFCGISVSCASRPVVIATDEPITNSQISTERIKGINEGIRNILRDYDGFIEAAIARAIRGNLDAEAALDQYDEFVQGLIQRIRELELATRPVEIEISGLIQYSDNWGGTLRD